MPEQLEVVNVVRDRLAAGELVTALSVRLVRTVEIARIAKTAGFDCLYVDLEHNAMTSDAASQICIAALDAGVAPFIRLRSGSSENIVTALDGGALGILIPQIRSAEAAREIVDAARFPPAGRRSVSSALPQFQFRSVPAAEAMSVLNRSTMIVLMIETLEALESLDEIAAVDGVDMLLIGGNDITAELGVPGDYGHAKARAAYSHIIATAAQHGIVAGVAGIPYSSGVVADLVAEGVRFVSAGTDLGLLLGASTSWNRTIRGSA